MNEQKRADLAIFMGQSNMAGRGEWEKATWCQKGHGYEFRSVTDPNALYCAEEPFGKNENNAAVNAAQKELAKERDYIRIAGSFWEKKSA